LFQCGEALFELDCLHRSPLFLKDSCHRFTFLGGQLCVEAIPTTLILLGINLAITAVFSLLAVRSSPGHAEQEALRVRRQALDAARGSLFITAAVPAATALLGFDRRRGRWRSWLRLFRR
jgi:hypothetical protein